MLLESIVSVPLFLIICFVTVCFFIFQIQCYSSGFSGFFSGSSVYIPSKSSGTSADSSNLSNTCILISSSLQSVLNRLQAFHIKPCSFFKVLFLRGMHFLGRDTDRKEANKLITGGNSEDLCHQISDPVVVGDMSLNPHA